MRAIFVLGYTSGIPNSANTLFLGEGTGWVRIGNIVSNAAITQVETNATVINTLRASNTEVDESNIDALSVTYGTTRDAVVTAFVGKKTVGQPVVFSFDVANAIDTPTSFPVVSAGLSDLLASAAPGATVEIEGRYQGSFSVPANVTLKRKANKIAVIDGQLNLGQGATLWGLEMICSDPDRWTDQSGSVPTDIPLNTGAYANVPGTRVINCYIHDVHGDGIQFFGSRSGEIYGNVFANNGWDAPDRGHGHGIYSHNHFGALDGVGITLKHNIFATAYATLFKLYSGSSNACRDYTVEENIGYGGRVIFGGEAGAVSGLKILRNVFYATETYDIGLRADANGEDVLVDGNTVFDDWSQLGLRSFEDATLLNNRWIAPGWYYATTPTNSFSLTDETFYAPLNAWRFVIDGVLYTDPTALPAGWKTGVTFTTTLPETAWTWVFPNAYEAEFGQVAIWNWEDSNTVSVDLSTLELTNGQTYRAYNTAAFLSDYFDFTYDGNPVSFAMTGHSIHRPIGIVGDPIIPDTFPRFGAWQIRRPGAWGETV